MANFCEKLYQFISDYINQYNQSPKFTEMIQAMGISPKSKSLITKSLRTLEKDRKILLTKNGRRLLISLPNNQLKLLGSISAGEPIEAISDPHIIEMNNLFSGSDRFALLVKGSSMVEEGILDGDMVICKKSIIAQEGDIVVILIDNHNVTLKRISYKMKGLITLIPANPELKPKAYAPERINIQGIYIGLIRTTYQR
jgi:repressor LexA